MKVFQAFQTNVILWWSLLSIFISNGYGGPLNIDSPNVDLTNNSLNEALTSLPSHRTGCRYRAMVYASGESVSTDEPCLYCHCKGSVVICKLRVCPEVPDPPPPGCIVVQKANKCCSQLVCHDNHMRKLSREQRLPGENETLPPSAVAVIAAAAANGSTDNQGNYCIHEGTVYAEGSAMRASTLCQHCFCIRGEMKCSSPQCVIPMNGCKPRFRSNACCPTNYDCNESNGTAILQTIPTSTAIPQFLKGCTVEGRFVPEGEPILPISMGHDQPMNLCQSCFCMGGVVHCQPLECDRPIGGCRPILEDGHCCPDRYDCQDQSSTNSTTTSPQQQLQAVITPKIQHVTPSNSSLKKEHTHHSPTAPLSTSDPSFDAATAGIPSIMDPLSASDTIRDAPATTALVEHPDTLLDSDPITTTIGPGNDEPITVKGAVSTEDESEKGVKEVKKPRVIFKSVGGFKNRSDGGSREERRNKGTVQESLRSFYEEDLPEESSSSFSISMDETSDQLDDRSLFFDEPSSNSDGDDDSSLAEAETTSPPTKEPSPSSLPTNDEELLTTEPSHDDLPDVEITDKVDPILQEMVTKSYSLVEDEVATTPVILLPPFKPEKPDPVRNETKLIRPSSPSTSASTSNLTSTTTVKPKANSSKKISPNSKVTEVPTTTELSASGNLEFIPFGMEDAVGPPPVNETRYEIYPGLAASGPSYDTVAKPGSLIPPTITRPKGYLALKPLKLQAPEGSDISGLSYNSSLIADQVPILVENDNEEEPIVHIPVQTSLYNNGYYKNNLKIEDPGREDQDLIITQAELDPPTLIHGFKGPHTNKIPPSSGIDIGTEVYLAPNIPTINQPKPPTPIDLTNRTFYRVNSPPKISSNFQSNSKFNQNPTFQPAIPDFTIENNPKLTNPSRTYSKFGVQDSSFHRYSSQQTGFVPSNLPPSLRPSQNDRLGPRLPAARKEVPQGRLRYSSSPYQPYEEPFVYEDASEELGSYDTYYNSPQSSSPSPMKHRLGSLAGGNVPILFNPVPLISSSGSTVSLSNSKTTKRPNKVINSKPLRRPRPEGDQTLDPGASDPLGFKPVVAFPFTIPKSQNNYNMGLKLSGCNIYGKMYGVGQVIRELSSICVQCLCTEVGVQCSELQC